MPTLARRKSSSPTRVVLLTPAQAKRSTLGIEQPPPLYVRDEDGKLRVRYDVVIHFKDGTADWNVATGIDGGALTITARTIKAKSRDTDFEQAVFEMHAKRKVVMKAQKYVENPSEAQLRSKAEHPCPMLALAWKDPKTKAIKVPIVLPCFVQPKLDGLRGPARVYFGPGSHKNWTVEIWSRRGNFFHGLPRIEAALRELAASLACLGERAKPFAEQGYIVFDGELFTRERRFQKINGIIHRKLEIAGSVDDRETVELKSLVQHWIYDIAQPGMKQSDRLELLEHLCDNAGVAKGGLNTFGAQHPIVRVPTVSCHTEQAVMDWHSQFVGDGYEGTMVRDPNADYTWVKRVKSLLKVKNFFDAEFTIIRMIPNEYLPGTGVFVMRYAPGPESEKTTFRAMPEGSFEDRTAVFRAYQTQPKAFIGKKWTVRYTETFENGKPRFGVARPAPNA